MRRVHAARLSPSLCALSVGEKLYADRAPAAPHPPPLSYSVGFDATALGLAWPSVLCVFALSAFGACVRFGDAACARVCVRRECPRECPCLGLLSMCATRVPARVSVFGSLSLPRCIERNSARVPPPLLLATLRSAFGWTLPTYQCLIQRSTALFDNLKTAQCCRRQPLSSPLPGFCRTRRAARLTHRAPWSTSSPCCSPTAPMPHPF